MKELSHLFENNIAWASKISASHPEFFSSLVAQQAPEYLWIGCSDSRVPANDIVGLLPGELFVHRNVGNTTIIQDAWVRGQKISIHGWIYDIADGLLKDLDVCITSRKELDVLQIGAGNLSSHA